MSNQDNSLASPQTKKAKLRHWLSKLRLHFFRTTLKAGKRKSPQGFKFLIH